MGQRMGKCSKTCQLTCFRCCWVFPLGPFRFDHLISKPLLKLLNTVIKNIDAAANYLPTWWSSNDLRRNGHSPAVYHNPSFFGLCCSCQASLKCGKLSRLFCPHCSDFPKMRSLMRCESTPNEAWSCFYLFKSEVMLLLYDIQWFW